MRTAKQQKKYYKDNPKQYKKHKDRMKKWNEKPENKIKHKKYMNKTRTKYKEKGLCYRCGKHKPKEGYIICESCNKNARAYQLRTGRKRKVCLLGKIKKLFNKK